jgi:SAM-dependent methyltransferase
MNRRVLEELGDVSDKVVLLLGNGDSEKELLLLDQGPRRLVFSDLSARGVQGVRDRFPLDESGVPLRYAAIDALRLPFPDGSIDVVYGYAFVHHLGDPVPFFREAVRVLRPGGRALFMDNRYSPVYQRAKVTILRPLMRYYHRQVETSPEDLHATETGWYSDAQLAEMLEPFAVEPFFHRSLLFHYLLTRASERLPPRRLFELYRRSDRAQEALVALDGWLSRFRAIRANQIRLVWGFTKNA